mgnify:CR=1 FL=1
MDAPALHDSAWGDTLGLGLAFAARYDTGAACPLPTGSLDAVAWLYATLAVLIVGSLVALIVRDMLHKGGRE